VTVLPRKHDRFSTCFEPVPVSFSGETTGVGKLYDISYGGCKIDSAITPPLGASVTLRFKIDKGGQPLVIGAGTVAWTVPQKYFGVKFANLSPHAERALDRYLTLLNQWFLSSPEGGVRNRRR
jgi:hypothetical protein